MLKSEPTEITSSIEEFTVSARHKYISIQIATGSIVDGAFISDGRGVVNHRIANMPDRAVQQVDVELIVDADGQVMLSRMPIDNNAVLINDAAVDHAGGQLVTCEGHAKGDVVTVSYYYTQPGGNWFDEAAAFVKEDHADYAGLNDYKYNAKRLWSILLEMGLVTGIMVK